MAIGSMWLRRLLLTRGSAAPWLLARVYPLERTRPDEVRDYLVEVNPSTMATTQEMCPRVMDMVFGGRTLDALDRTRAQFQTPCNINDRKGQVIRFYAVDVACVLI